jgi:hypothetical protein
VATGSPASPRARFVKGVALAAALAAVSLTASASSAGAAVTIGQLGTPPSPNCEEQVDRVQPAVTSGDSYVVPSTGGATEWNLTSWSTSPPAGDGFTMTMKVFRPVNAATFTAVAHDGPRALTGGALNTFETNIAVKAGDVLGLNVPAAPAFPCGFVVAGDSYLRTGSGTDLADGLSAPFPTAVADRRLNIEAVVTPTNTFALGEVTRNKKKGTAALAIEALPNPGELTLSGAGLKTTTATAAAPGSVPLTVKARGNKKRKLKNKGKVNVAPDVTYTPTGGEPNTQSTTLKLKKR